MPVAGILDPASLIQFGAMGLCVFIITQVSRHLKTRDEAFTAYLSRRDGEMERLSTACHEHSQRMMEMLDLTANRMGDQLKASDTTNATMQKVIIAATREMENTRLWRDANKLLMERLAAMAEQERGSRRG